MRKNCYANPNLSDRLKIRILLLLALIPSLFFGQTLSGVWTGRLTNDSLNTRKDQTYELALTEYRGKVYGYSYTTFIYNDTLYYIVKRVKGTIENGVCEVVDDEIVAHNFHGRMDKKVKVTQTFRMNQQDSSWNIAGNWKTNQTKEFYALTGGLALQQEKDFDKSRLLQHLGDLKRDKDLAFYKPEEKVYLSAPRRTAVKKEEPIIAKVDPKKRPIDTNSGVGALEIKNPEQPEIVLNKPDQSVAATEKPNIISAKKPETIQGQTVAVTVGNPPAVEKPQPEVVLNKPNQSVVSTEKPSLVADKKPETIQGQTVSVTLNAPVFEERKKKVIQTVEYKTDSLILSLYDNGEVDGDTVSVFLNGETFLSNQGLKSTAIKKTIYTSGQAYEEIEIILFAENLGRYPPNTGLLIIRDGEDRHEIRFSADFEQSAAIRLVRKKN